MGFAFGYTCTNYNQTIALAAGETARFRATISLERQINELAAAIEESRRANDEKHQRTDNKLDKLLIVVNSLQVVPTSSFVPATIPTSNSNSSGTDSSTTRPDLTNPRPSQELVEIVFQVISETRTRVGKKKNGAHENSFKVCMHFDHRVLVAYTCAHFLQLDRSTHEQLSTECSALLLRNLFVHILRTNMANLIRSPPNS
jgi:hypothetical protein